jgi:hypothetical protein
MIRKNQLMEQAAFSSLIGFTSNGILPLQGAIVASFSSGMAAYTSANWDFPCWVPMDGVCRIIIPSPCQCGNEPLVLKGETDFITEDS